MSPEPSNHTAITECGGDEGNRLLFERGRKLPSRLRHFNASMPSKAQQWFHEIEGSSEWRVGPFEDRQWGSSPIERGAWLRCGVSRTGKRSGLGQISHGDGDDGDRDNAGARAASVRVDASVNAAR